MGLLTGTVRTSTTHGTQKATVSDCRSASTLPILHTMGFVSFRFTVKGISIDDVVVVAVPVAVGFQWG